MSHDRPVPTPGLGPAAEVARQWVPEPRRRRVPAEFPLTFLASLDGPRHYGAVANVSVGGLFVQSSALLPVGTAIRVTFFLPLAAGPKPMATSAWVRWINEPGAPKAATLPPGMGIEFLGLDAAGRAALEMFLSERTPPGMAH